MGCFDPQYHGIRVADGVGLIWARELQAFAVFSLVLAFATWRLEIGQGPALHLYTGRVHLVLRFSAPDRSRSRIEQAIRLRYPVSMC